MPRFNRFGDVVSGSGDGIVAINGHEIARGRALWLSDHRVIYQQSPQDVLYTYDRMLGPVSLVNRGANTLAAGGGHWLGWLSGFGLFGINGLIDARACLAGTSQEQDGRGAASPDGHIAICRDQQSGVGFAIVSPDGEVTAEVTDSIAISMQVLDATSAVWIDEHNRPRAIGLPAPDVPLLKLYAVRTIVVAGVRYLLGATNDGLILYRWDHALVGWSLLGDAFYPDMRAIDDTRVEVVYSRRAGELPGDMATWLVDLRSTPLPIGVQPIPPKQPEEPEPTMPFAPDLSSRLSAIWAAHAHINTREEGERGAMTDAVVIAFGGRPWGRKDRDQNPDNHNNSDDALCYLLPDGRFEIYDIINGTTGEPQWDYKGTFAPGENGFFRDVVTLPPIPPKPPEHPPIVTGSIDAIVQAAIAAAVKPLKAELATMKAEIAALKARPTPEAPSFPARVAIKSDRGRYLRDEWADNSARFDRESAGAGETFTLEPIE